MHTYLTFKNIFSFLFILLFSTVIAFGSPLQSFAAIIHQDNFEYSDSPKNHGWDGVGSNVSVGAWGKNGTRGLRINYTGAQGTAAYVLAKNIDSNVAEIYVEADFKIPTNMGSNIKFIKLFGKTLNGGYANTTFGTDKTLRRIAYGSGSGTQNDTQVTIPFDPTKAPHDTQVDVRVAKGTFDPRDGAWHKIKVYMKYNTNGNRDGEYKVWIDGVLWAHATNVKNRHDSNIRAFNKVTFGDYSTAGSQWYLYFDNITISSDGAGGTSPEPDPGPTPPPVPGGTTVCHKLNSSSPVMSGFGAAYDPYSPSTLLMKTLCNDSSVYIEIGDNKNTRYIYRYGYILKNNSWQRLDLLPFSSTNARNGDWIIGKAKATYPLTSTELTKDNYVLSYTCDLINNQWKCGCRDTACTTSYWQLQWFKQ